MGGGMLRVHVCNDPAEPPAITLGPERLSRALAGRPDLAGRVVASFGRVALDGSADISDVDVLFTNGIFALDEAKRLSPVGATVSGSRRGDRQCQ